MHRPLSRQQQDAPSGMVYDPSAGSSVMSSSPSMAATLLTITCSVPLPAKGELNATTSPVKTALRLGRGMQRIRSLSTVLVPALLPSEELL